MRAGDARGGEGHTNQTNNTPVPRNTPSDTTNTPFAWRKGREPAERSERGMPGAAGHTHHTNHPQSLPTPHTPLLCQPPAIAPFVARKGRERSERGMLGEAGPHTNQTTHHHQNNLTAHQQSPLSSHERGASAASGVCPGRSGANQPNHQHTRHHHHSPLTKPSPHIIHIMPPSKPQLKHLARNLRNNPTDAEHTAPKKSKPRQPPLHAPIPH